MHECSSDSLFLFKQEVAQCYILSRYIPPKLYPCLPTSLVIVALHQETDPAVRGVVGTKDTIVTTAVAEDIRLSIASLCADHFHGSMGCHFKSSPQDIAVAFLNNLANAHGSRALYEFSYYVGTVGNYDMDAIRRRIKNVNGISPTVVPPLGNSPSGGQERS